VHKPFYAWRGWKLDILFGLYALALIFQDRLAMAPGGHEFAELGSLLVFTGLALYWLDRPVGRGQGSTGLDAGTKQETRVPGRMPNRGVAVLSLPSRGVPNRTGPRLQDEVDVR
jgi:hypothetical protein